MQIQMMLLMFAQRQEHLQEQVILNRQTTNGGEKLKQQVYNKVRQGMGITETLDEYAVAQQRPKKIEIKYDPK